MGAREPCREAYRPGERRGHDDHQRHRQEPDPCLERRVTADQLHVQRQEEERREHARARPRTRPCCPPRTPGCGRSGAASSRAGCGAPSTGTRRAGAAPATSVETISGSLHPFWFASINAYVQAEQRRRAQDQTGDVQLPLLLRDRLAARSGSRPGTRPGRSGRSGRRSTATRGARPSAPPTVGPSASARPDTPAHRPIAFARSCGGNVTVMIDSVPGISSAAPTPWIARNAISCRCSARRRIPATRA